MKPAQYQIIIFFCLVLCFPLVAKAFQGTPQKYFYNAEPHFISEHWTTNNGLPINHINQVHQTPDGFIWLATFNGLIRFDGITYREFNSGNTPELPSNRILAIQPGIGNSFWINTEQGHLVLVENGNFKSFEKQFPTVDGIITIENRIRVRTDGDRTWISAKNGLFLYQDHELQAIRSDLFDFSANTSVDRKISTIHVGKDQIVRLIDAEGLIWEIDSNLEVSTTNRIPEIIGADAVMQDSNGTYWIAKNQIVRVDQNGYSILSEPVELKNDWDRSHPYYLSIQEKPNGTIMVSTLNGMIKISNDSLSVLDHIESKIHGTFPDMLGSSFATCSDSSVWAIVQDRVYRNGEYQFLADAHGVGIYCDREMNLWIPTRGSGLYRYRQSQLDNFSFHYTTPSFYGVFIDSYNTYWTGGFSELTQVDTNGTIHEGVNRGAEGATAAFYEDSEGSFWNGYHRCRAENRTETGACLDFETITELNRNNVFAVFEDPEKRMWFGTDIGLFRLAGGIVEEISLSESGSQRPVRYFLESSDSSLWMATNGSGIFRYQNGKSVAYTRDQGLTSNNVRALFEDENGFIWIATEDLGLNRLNPDTGEVAVIQKKDGLFEDGLHKMLLDHFGRMWFSTNQGIFWVPFDHLQQFADGNRNRIQSTYYNERNGMLNREANGGFQNSGFKSEDGRLFFATQSGIVVIDPDHIDIQTPFPAVIIDDFRVGNESIYSGDSPIQLTKNQRSFSIQFTAPFFKAPDRVRYHYKLNGFDEDWNDAGGRREAIYTNIPAGTYLFSVTADLGDEESAFVETTHAIVISPFFYETTWFPVVNVLLIGCLIAGGYRLRLRHQIKRERHLESVVAKRTDDLRSEKLKTEKQAEQLRLLSQEKNRFFTNISHEFRTPLTLTIAPLENLKSGKYGDLTPQGEQQINMAIRNSKRLIRLVNQLMDLAKFEAQLFKLKPEPVNLNQYLRYISARFVGAAERNQVSFIQQIPENMISVSIDPEQFEKVVFNLLSNAFKFTPKNGQISISLHSENNDAIIKVKDSGIGISIEHLPRLFDRFYQVEKSELQPGSGIGLALVKEITEQHGGVVQVKSEIDKGTEFSVSLPVIKDYFPEESLIDRPSNIDFDAYEELAETHENGRSDTNEPDNSDRKTILAVDDNPDIRSYLREQLAGDYNVLEAASGSEALKQIHETLPDVIISDIMMPDGDGFNLLKELRSNAETSFLPVILLTARAEAEDKLEGLGIGADDYITKPFSMDEVTARVHNLIERQKRLQKHFAKESERIISNKPENHPDPVDVESADHVYLERIRTIVQERMHNEDFSVEDLSALMFQSRTQLFRRMKELINETPSGFIKRMRLERGADLLVKKAGNVSEIAYSTGFRSVAQFSKSFRDHFGESPTSYTSSKTT